MAESIDMDKAIAAAEHGAFEGDKIRKFAEQLWKTSGVEDALKTSEPIADKERLFLTPLIWALFSAYRSIIGLTMVQFTLMRTGAGPKLLKDPEKTVAAVKSALPHYATFIDEHGAGSLVFLLDDLEEAILNQIRINLDTSTSDERSIAQAASILKAVDEITTLSQVTTSIEIPASLARSASPARE